MEQSRELFSNIRGKGGASNADIRSQDLGLPIEYSLGHRGLFAASRCKVAFTSRHYALFTATDTTALYKTLFFFFFFFLSRSKLIFKVPTTT